MVMIIGNDGIKNKKQSSSEPRNYKPTYNITKNQSINDITE